MRVQVEPVGGNRHLGLIAFCIAISVAVPPLIVPVFIFGVIYLVVKLTNKPSRDKVKP